MKKAAFIFAVVAAVLLVSAPAGAQETEDNTFGGWEFFEVNHDFGSSRWFGTFYFEHDNYQYKRLECWYTRTTLGYKICKWLKADIAYDFMREPGDVNCHRAVFDVTGTLKEGNLKVAIRERYMHNWRPALGTQGNELRSRLKVQYSIPDSRFSPYVAAEVFTWGDTWKKTRHYVALDYNLNEHVQFEGYYLYYAFNGLPAEHVIGIGVNFDI